jgi:hypothetical protein
MQIEPRKHDARLLFDGGKNNKGTPGDEGEIAKKKKEKRQIKTRHDGF